MKTSVTIIVEKIWEDAISEFLMQNGSPAVVIDDPSLIPECHYDVYNKLPTEIPSGFIKITGSFDDRMLNIKQTISDFLRKFSIKFTISVEDLPDKNWDEESRKSYRGIEIKNFVRVLPYWEQSSSQTINFPDETTVILINPGTGFGTGAHPTTYMCLESMTNMQFKDKTVLDAGCGSGLLGICSLMLGSKSVTLTDFDDDALSNTQENLLLNKLTSGYKCINYDLTKNSFPEIETYDILFLNIFLNVISEFVYLNRNKIKKGAILLITGVLKKDEIKIERLFKNSFLEIKNKRQNEDWLFYKVTA